MKFTSKTTNQSAMPYSVTSTEGAIESASFTIPMSDTRDGYMMHRTDVEGYFITELSDDDYTVSLSGLGTFRELNMQLAIPAADGFRSNDGLLLKNLTKKYTEAIHGDDFEKNVTVPKFVDNAWLKLKEICSATKTTFDYVRKEFRSSNKMPTHTLTDGDLSTRSITVSEEEPADIVHVAYYEYSNFRHKDVEIFPRFSSTGEMVNISAEAGEQVEVDIDLDFAVESLSGGDPKALEWVNNREYLKPVFSVVGKDDLPIKPRMFYDYGGYLQVRLNRDSPRKITVVFHAPTFEDYGPYRVAMSSGDGNDYNSLHIIGRGVGIRRYEDDVLTGAKQFYPAPREQTVDNPYVCTPSSLMNARIDAARAHSGLVRRATFTLRDLSRFPDLMAGDFVFYDGIRWRIDTVSNDQASLTLSCSEHYTIADLNLALDIMGVKTARDFKMQYQGLDMSISRPLGVIFG